MSAKTYTASDHALAQAQALEIDEAQLLKMARLAARFTHPDANHRYRQYIMWIDSDGMVTMIDLMDRDEADYYQRRTYEERKAEEDPGEAEVQRKSGGR